MNDSLHIELEKQDSQTTSDIEATNDLPKFNILNIKKGTAIDLTAINDALEEGEKLDPNDLLPRDGTAPYVSDVVHLGPGCVFGK